MWKSISFRRPLRRQDVAPAKAPPRRAEPPPEGPFADLMAKLDAIPYRRTLRRAPSM